MTTQPAARAAASATQPAARVVAVPTPAPMTDEQLLSLMVAILASSTTPADIVRDIRRARQILVAVRASEAERRGDIAALPRERPAK